jgi:prephenate dehydrogenase
VTAPASLVGRRCLVAGGAGAVGTMLVDLLLGAGAEVCVVDAGDSPTRVGPTCSFERGDIRAPDARLAAQLRRADMAILAVPEQVALDAVAGVAGALRPGTLVVDTLTVKSAIDTALRAHAAHLEAVSLNPMFAPSLGIDGQTVAAVVVHDGPQAQALLELLGRRARVIVVGAAEHDRLTGAAQALTHAAVLAFGLALAELDVDIGELGALAPPPHITMLALLARIASGQPETYWDAQAANPHAEGARAALAGAIRRLADLVDGGGEPGFATLLADLRAGLGGDLEHYRGICEQLFHTATAAGRPPAHHAAATPSGTGNTPGPRHVSDGLKSPS